MNEQETTEDIIAEMRGLGNYQQYSGDHARQLADRLKAALKRERESADAKIADLQSRVKLWTDRSAELVKKCDELYANAHKRELSKNASKNGADFGQLGNAAKSREAAKAAYDKLLLWNYTDGDTARMALGVMNKLDAALAEPPRQCEVGTAEEQEERFVDFCSSHYRGPVNGMIESAPCNCPCWRNGRCNNFVWANMPYVEKEGGAK